MRKGFDYEKTEYLENAEEKILETNVLPPNRLRIESMQAPILQHDNRKNKEKYMKQMTYGRETLQRNAIQMQHKGTIEKIIKYNEASINPVKRHIKECTLWLVGCLFFYGESTFLGSFNAKLNSK